MKGFSFIIKSGRVISDNVPLSYKSIRKDGKLLIAYDNLHPEPKVFRQNSKMLIMLGSPICGEKIDHEKACNLLLEDLSKSLLSTINGSFLFILYENSRVTIINDRFASIPFYYRIDNGTLTGALSYSDIWRNSQSRQDFIPNKEAFFEFFHIKQLLGDKTYDYETKCLMPGSIMRYHDKEMCCERYWEPHYNVKEVTFEDFTYRFLETLKCSLKRRCLDGKDYGLLLSGGLDSRLILAAIEVPVTCFTVGDSQNTEVQVARRIAEIKNCQHVFLQRDINFYHSIISSAVSIGGGMYSFENAHFMNYEEIDNYNIDVMMHGCFLDSLFQGSYLPKKPRKIGRFSSSFYKILDIKGSLIESYLSSIKYRLKSINPLVLIKDDRKKEMVDALHQSINDIIEEGSRHCNDEYEIWDYLSFHNISRYWSFLNVLSIRVDLEECAPALDNDLFDLYFSMPLKYKLYAGVPKRALLIANSEMAKFVSANSGNKMVNTPLMDTVVNFKKRALSKLTSDRKNKQCHNPIFTERSWLNFDEYIRQVAPMRELAEGLKQSDLLESIGIFDMDEVRKVIDRHLNDEGNFSDVIFRLVTIERLLSMII